MRLDTWNPVLAWVIGAPIAALITALGAYMIRVLGHVNKQMRNNGGSSLLDKIDRIEQAQDKLVAWQKRQDKKLRKLEKLKKLNHLVVVERKDECSVVTSVSSSPESTTATLTDG